MFKTRQDEPEYALLSDKDAETKNRYGMNIETVRDGDVLHGASLNINGDGTVSDNPNRYKQHGFHFTADNCIACHACEAACSEKNDNPSHIAFRSVGFVESGTYPDYARINISMACNHCDDPVCLTGCPTRAYTKFAEYGAVLQDPDICFGCGYCTWVCPYNAPQLDPVKGQVSKCNMCVDRLEVGLKPACVSACLGNALDFGVIENTPERRDQTKTQIPGFPTPEITHPNIRFQLSRTLQRVFSRPDGAPLKYVRSAEGFASVTDEQKAVAKRQWNLGPLLSSHENAHIIFTLCTQAVMGAFLIRLLGLTGPALVDQEIFLPLMTAMLGVLTYGLVRLNLHLGKPQFFYRGFYNWRLSPVSREIAGVSLFFAGLAGYAFFGTLGIYFLSSFDAAGLALMLMNLASMVTVTGAIVGLYYMIKLYLIPARPFWNHWQTAASFTGTAISLGALFLTIACALRYGIGMGGALTSLCWIAFIGLTLEALGLIAHARDLRSKGGEGAASHFEQTSRYGKTYWLRNLLLLANLITLASIAWFGLPSGLAGWALAITLTVSMLTCAILGRALFYVLVIPTTMPGAFFWRNKSFEQHARKTGIADRIKAGVTRSGH